MFRQRNQGSKLVKSYHLHKHTRWIKGQKYIKNMPENNQKTLYALSTDKTELHIKSMKWVVRGGKKLQTLELTICSNVGLFVDSHPKFTCQTQSISGSHT